MRVLGGEQAASKLKETAPVQEQVNPPSSEEPRQKSDSGKPAARMKTEPKMIKQEPAASPEMTAGKPTTAATSASQVTTFSSDES